MSEFCAAALARALSYCCSIESGTLEGFLDRLAWELQHESGRIFSSLAIIIRRGDGSSFVAAPRELSSLPVEVLLGLLIEENGAHIGCRVRDHALDTLRFIDPIFRSSVTTRIVFPKDLLPNGEAALWFGSRGIATSEHVKLAQSFATTCTEWLELYAPVLLSIGAYRKRVDTLKNRNSEMQAIAHDVKAPIAALKYLISESRISDSQVSEELSRLGSELIYVERLLGKFAPESLVELNDAANYGDLNGYDLAALLRRVQERFVVESRAQGNQIVLNCPADLRVSCQMPGLELERILSNVIGNAVRYSGAGEIIVRADIDDKSRLVIQVRDKGPGIPSNVVNSVLACRAIPGDSEGGGWGLGLISCKKQLVAYAGDLKIYSDGSKCDKSECVVEVIVPISAAGPLTLKGVEPKYCGEFSKSTNASISMIIVDDDVDHSSSLERILRRKDIRVNCFDSIEQAMALIREQEGSIVLCDGHMPDGGAERLLGALREGDIKRYCAVMSGDSNDQLLYRFAALGAREFFAKPLDVERVIEWVKRLE